MVAELRQRLEQIEADKHYYGENYHDYGLLFCQPNGDPIEPSKLLRWFKEWQEASGFDYPIICFHELGRNSSTTYKLKVSNGDIKSVQGDNGHSSAEITANVYAKIMDDDRRSLSKIVELDFYNMNDDDKSDDSGFDDLILAIKDNPLVKERVISALLA